MHPSFMETQGIQGDQTDEGHLVDSSGVCETTGCPRQAFIPLLPGSVRSLSLVFSS